MQSQNLSHCNCPQQESSDLVEGLGVDIVPYIVLLVVPVMGRMSDQDQSVRLLATQCFASLIRLMPLEVRNEPNTLVPKRVPPPPKKYIYPQNNMLLLKRPSTFKAISSFVAVTPSNWRCFRISEGNYS